MDLTPIHLSNRYVRLPLSKWRGHGDESFFCVMGEAGFQVNVWVEEGLWDLTPIATIDRRVRSPLSQGFRGGQVGRNLNCTLTI